MSKFTTLASFVSIMGLIIGCSSTKDNSKWMTQNKSTLETKTLGQITIPGSHFANAYNMSSTQAVCRGETVLNAQSMNAKIIALNHNFTESVSNEFITYLNTQDENIYQQLSSGIRYLELQICQQDNSFYTSNYFLGDILANVIAQINSFMAENPDEIIILDLDNNVRDENGFIAGKNAKQLISTLKQSFSEHLITSEKINNIQKDSLKHIWSSKERILIMSSNPALIDNETIWDKNQVIALNYKPRWTTIKKLTSIQIAVDDLQESPTHGMSIIPIYSLFNPERNTPQEIGNNFNNHLIIDYLYTFPESTPINILVSEGQFNYDIVKFSLRTFNDN